jgi:mono/diheme cytochrome c family protein
MRLPTLALPGLLVAAVLAAGASVSCVDEVHDQEVAALGPTDLPNGPTHRAGQPCLVCHGGSGPAKAVFTLAGTVVQVQDGSSGAEGAIVLTEDVDGRTHVSSTNSVGNFFVTPDDFTPHYPAQMTVTSSDGSLTEQMLTHVGRDGSCADCHKPTEGPSSAGPVYLQLASAPGDGG